jgi:hypothetical protein
MGGVHVQVTGDVVKCYDNHKRGLDCNQILDTIINFITRAHAHARALSLSAFTTAHI